ncbi:MAG: hypothetical protein Q9224_003710, partial [Gallowayella concinna]
RVFVPSVRYQPCSGCMVEHLRVRQKRLALQNSIVNDTMPFGGCKWFAGVSNAEIFRVDCVLGSAGSSREAAESELNNQTSVGLGAFDPDFAVAAVYWSTCVSRDGLVVQSKMGESIDFTKSRGDIQQDAKIEEKNNVPHFSGTKNERSLRKLQAGYEDPWLAEEIHHSVFATREEASLQSKHQSSDGVVWMEHDKGLLYYSDRQIRLVVDTITPLTSIHAESLSLDPCMCMQIDASHVPASSGKFLEPLTNYFSSENPTPTISSCWS